MDRDALEMRPDAAADWPDRIYAVLKAQNITQKTRPKDFERNQHIHNCWIITHAPEQGEA